MTQPARRSGSPFGAPEPVEFVLELPSDVHRIEAAVAFLARRCENFAFGGSRLRLNFRVGVTEALANAMLYGNGSDFTKRVRVEVHLSCDRVDLRVIDQGTGFDPDSVPDPTLPGNRRRSRGRGLFLIHELMDEVEFNDRGNVIRLVLFRNGSAEVPGE